MKRYYLLAAAAIVFAGCSNNEFVGEDSGRTQESGQGQIAFSSTLPAATRAWYGADAAAKLNNKFIVSGFSGDKSTNAIASTTVFDNYQVKWTANTAGTTASNTADWEYVGLTAAPPSKVSGEQTIKYWNYSAGQYDFIAYSTGDADVITDGDVSTGKVKVSAITAPTKDDSAAYTIQGAAADLAKCYIADLVTAYNPEETGKGKPKFGDRVQFNFRNLTTKVRVALYETVPGYSVKDVRFYADDDNKTATADNTTITSTDATLYPTPTAPFATAGTLTVFFPTVGTENIAKSDYNKAHVDVAADEGKTETSHAFGNLNYVNSDDNRLVKTGEGEVNNIYLGTTLPKASYAGESTSDYYQTMLPNEAGSTLTLRVNYTLVSNDGSGEVINVYGAKAIVPAVYAQWKSNYAYTYVFKISDKTNGKTGLGKDDPEGLFPITFDAMVTDVMDGTQATVTTVATPSITTYQKGHDVKKDEHSVMDEYSAAKGDIYVMVDGKSDLNTKGQLYTVTANEGVAISEATVHDALTIGAGGDGEASRNGITLKKAESDATITSIPGVDGNDITVAAGAAAKFTPVKDATTTYAYAYTLDDGKDKATELHTAVTLTGDKAPDDWKDNYYTDQGCTQKAENYAAGTYYKKVTNTGATYAIKVIKVVE